VAAVAALLYAAGASGPDEVEKALYAGAKRVNGAERTDEYGHGLLNAQASLEALGVGGGTQWPSLWWAVGLLAFVLLTLGRGARPGFLNILFTPSFLVSLLMATVGVFFARSIFGGADGAAGEVVNAVSLPIPDWQKIIFGRGKLANPLFYSALIPMILSFFAIKFTGLRPAIGGLAIGFAGFLAYGAWAKAPALSYMPFTFLAVPWLVVNTLLCLFIARAMLKKETV
jgi:serine protease